MASKTIEGPTPNGGVKSVMTYLDDDGNEVERERATRCVVAEYDADGNSIHRTYARLEKAAE